MKVLVVKPLFLRRLIGLLAFAVLSACGLSACADSGSSPEGDKPLIYASFYPIYSLVSDIAGDEADVRSFMPSGQDPHLWEPTPNNIKELSQADLLVVNGANMEPWLPQVEDILPNLKILQLSEYVDLINYKGAAARGEFQYLASGHFSKGQNYSMIFAHTHERSLRGAFFRLPDKASTSSLVEKGREVMSSKGAEVEQHSTVAVEDGTVYDIKMGHEAGDVTFTFPSDGDWVFVSDRISEGLLTYSFVDSKGDPMELEQLVEGGSAKTDTSTFDPHSWLSIDNAKRYSNAINDTLAQMYPGGKSVFAKNKSAVVRELTNMQAKFADQIKNLERRDFLTAHNAFAYLARDYQLTQHPLQGLTTNDAPRLRVLVDSIRFARSQNIRVVFYEDGMDPKSAEVVAEEIGGEALPLNSMEYGGGDKGYLGYMRMNLDNLYTAIAGLNENR